jgi:membrane-associated protease RseP (regulator of RpoE activity)
MAPRFGQDFDGIIGSNFIREFVIEVDYLARVLRLHDKKKFVYTGPGESIPIQLNHAGHPFVEAEVTPIGSSSFKGKFLVDLGSTLALALYSPFVAENQLLKPDLKTIRALGGGGAGGETTGRLGRVAELKLGKFRVSQPITMFSEDKAGAFASREVLGNIGAQILNRFKIFLDYDNSRIILEPNEDFGKPYDRAFSGLTIRADGQDYRTFRITRVLENSPASEAGLQENDIITSIDGDPAPKMNLTRLNEMFEREASYQLIIRRGEQTLSVKLKPRRLV